MNYAKRKPRLELTNLASRTVPSPAPMYASTVPRRESLWSPQVSNNDSKYAAHQRQTHSYIPAASESAWTLPRFKGDTPQGAEDVTSPDHRDPNYPLYANPATPDYQVGRPLNTRWPKKTTIIPWLLAAVFFLITLWYTSILFGARFFSTLFPLPAVPVVPEVNVIINGEVLHGAVSIISTIPDMQTTALNMTGSASTTNIPPSSRHSTSSILTEPASSVPPSDNSGNNQGVTLLLSEEMRPAPTTMETVIEKQE